MTIKRNLHWLIYILFTLSCARQSAPTGGPKDTIPPILVRAIPSNEATHFKAPKIELEFSENVILNSPKEQLIVTPTISKDYKITFRKNTVTLEFDEPLQDSTTYTFNFRESVADITEKNPVRNLTLAYSTGTYIDSLSIEGTISNLLKGDPIGDATVALHVQNDTFNIFEHPAVYFTKTDKKGNFKISHLKPGSYFLYAFEDKNRNLVVNSRSESYGFVAEHQYLLENIKDISLGLVRLDAGPLKLTSARPYNTYYNIRTSKNLRTFSITAADSSDLSYTFGENQANIRVYQTTDKDSVQLRLLAMDSLSNIIDTTLYAKYQTREVTPEPFSATLTSSSLLAKTGELTATLQFTKPLKEINFDSLYLQVDSLTRVNFSQQDVTWEPLPRTLKLRKHVDPALYHTEQSAGHARRGRPQPTPQEGNREKKPEQLNELHFRPAAFISIENDSSQKISQTVKPVTEQELSVVNVEIRTEADSFLVELIDRNFNIIQQIKNTHRIRFKDVIPGDYQLRLIIDRNANGRWDPGNYFDLIEPEPIIYYTAPDGSKIIKGVKANWEVGTDGEMFISY